MHTSTKSMSILAASCRASCLGTTLWPSSLTSLTKGEVTALLMRRPVVSSSSSLPPFLLTFKVETELDHHKAVATEFLSRRKEESLVARLQGRG